MPIRSEIEIQQAATIKIPPATRVRYLAYHLFQGGHGSHVFSATYQAHCEKYQRNNEQSL
ncbi:hypothetical protein [Coxiella-like endosymbiont of Rhipicephalus sanguineus]|uniref:hypothetical protein n=1 Tax=Coxiella-like endosymbiont of Rhipicephalus sanguineus TaxID=1955402 RepID=UPI00203AC5C8|nr:hypothetical protein [Coxiella-like endosymbiont of Rhipicephalus sanguineus]